jgi:beta-alanine--pyruvate transaminase
MALDRTNPAPNDLSAFWMPFTANRQFKKSPRMFVSADRMHYKTADGREVLDGTAGLWCCNAGHNRPKIVEAIQKQAAELDYAPAFQMGHPKAFELANRCATWRPSPSSTCSSPIPARNRRNRAEDRARLPARHRAGDADPPDRARARLSRGEFRRHLGRRDRQQSQVLRHIVDRRRPPAAHASARQERLHPRPAGAWRDLADDLERIVALHGPETVAAVIVEPMAGSTGVLIPPKGYLQRLREICTKHGILLIFDEVITGFGRLGAPFAADHFDVMPDLITCAKGLTNGVIPMGAVLATKEIHDAFMQGPEHMIELFHGYTYSGNPIASAAGIATLETYREEGLFERAAELAPYWEDAVHSLKPTART